jgi:abortive infection bacteriophage resistance protein
LDRKPFTKQALDLQDQAITLAGRGLVFDDWASAIGHLEHIGYYRLTGYLYPFRKGGDGEDKESFRAGTTFDVAHDRYVFDRRLRMLVLSGIEKVEIAVRAAISNAVATRHGPHWYLDRKYFAQPKWYHEDGFSIERWHANFLNQLKAQIGHTDVKRRDVFIRHYYETYSHPEMPPCWMVFEAISLGPISQCFKFLKHPEYEEVCWKFDLTHQNLSSWLHSTSYIRNICAHHSRLWNRICTIKPLIPRKFRHEFNGSNDRIYAALLALQILLRQIWDTNELAEGLRNLLKRHPDLPLHSMGFPPDWETKPVWQLS